MKAGQTTLAGKGIGRGTRQIAALSVAVLLGSAAHLDAHAQSGQTPVSQPQPSHSILRPEANRLPDANDIMEMRQTKVSQAKLEAANLERKRQIDSDTALLLKLAGEVKAEIDKDPGNAGSPVEMAKVEAIRRLAHGIQVKMKLAIIPAE